MSFYPYNPELGQQIQTDVNGVNAYKTETARVVYANPAAASNTSLHAAVTLGIGTTTTITTNITNPDFARGLRIKGNAATVTGNVVISGTNLAGEAITETIAANAANTVDGAKAFKTVTQIVLPARGAEGDTISIGVNDKLGLPYKLRMNTVILAALGGTKEATAPTVTVNDTALESNTVDFSSALNGTKAEVYLLVGGV